MEGTPDRTHGSERPSLSASLLGALLGSLIFGAVGPIFLIIGLFKRGTFALPLGIAITAVALLAGLWAGVAEYRASMRRFRLARRSQPSTAEVIDWRLLRLAFVVATPFVKVRVRLRSLGIESSRWMFHVDASRVLTDATSIPVRVDPETGRWDVDWSRVREPRPPSPSTRWSRSTAPSGDRRPASMNASAPACPRRSPSRGSRTSEPAEQSARLRDGRWSVGGVRLG